MAAFLRRPHFKRPALRVEQVASAFSGGVGANRWSNIGTVPPISESVFGRLHTDIDSADLDPIRREDRKWSVWALVAYWFSDAFNAATWEFAASILAIGLSYKDAIGIVATAFLLVSIVIALNGATGVLYHAPFPVLARASWGFWGSYGK